MYTSLNTQRQHEAASVQIFVPTPNCIEHAFEAAPRWLLENFSDTPRSSEPVSAQVGSSIAMPRLVRFSLLSNALVLYSFQTIRRLFFTQILFMKSPASTITGLSTKINTWPNHPSTVGPWVWNLSVETQHPSAIAGQFRLFTFPELSAGAFRQQPEVPT